MADRKSQSNRNRPSRRSRQGRKRSAMVFQKKNYVLLIIGLVMIIGGYVIMRMDNQVDGFISLYIAPVLILGGYLEIIWAILWRPKATSSQQAESA